MEGEKVLWVMEQQLTCSPTGEPTLEQIYLERLYPWEGHILDVVV